MLGSGEVWFKRGVNRYYTGSNRNCKVAGAPCPAAADQQAVLGVVDGTSVLVETIPQSSGSHSVAADSKRNLIFVPQTWTRPPGTTVPAGDANTIGGGATTVSQLLCGGGDRCSPPSPHNMDHDE